MPYGMISAYGRQKEGYIMAVFRGTTEPKKIFGLLTAYYLLFYMADNISFTYLPVYYGSFHISQSQIGMITAAGAVMSIVAQPIWGLMADRAKCKNNVLLTMIFGVGASYMLFFVPNQTFLTLVLFTCFWQFFFSTFFALSDTVCLECLAFTKVDFGVIRSLGSIGFCLMALFMAIFAGKMSMGERFAFFPALMFLSMIPVLFLPKIRGHQYVESKDKAEKNKEKLPLTALFRYKNVTLVLLFMFLTLIPSGFYSGFFSLYYTSEIGANDTLLNIFMAISSVCEVPFMFIAAKAVRRVSFKTLIYVTSFVHILRYLALGLMKDPYLILPVAALTSITTVMVVYAGIVYINNNVSKKLRASGQSVWAVVAYGISKIAGSTVGGVVSGHIGMANTFLVSAVFVLILCIIFWFIMPSDLNTPPDEIESLMDAYTAKRKARLAFKEEAKKREKSAVSN